MTRKDYILIASRLRAMLPTVSADLSPPEDQAYVNGYRCAIDQVIGAFSSDNPRFDRDRFRSACGLSAE